MSLIIWAEGYLKASSPAATVQKQSQISKDALFQTGRLSLYFFMISWHQTGNLLNYFHTFLTIFNNLLCLQCDFVCARTRLAARWSQRPASSACVTVSHQKGNLIPADTNLRRWNQALLSKYINRCTPWCKKKKNIHVKFILVVAKPIWCGGIRAEISWGWKVNGKYCPSFLFHVNLAVVPQKAYVKLRRLVFVYFIPVLWLDLFSTAVTSDRALNLGFKVQTCLWTVSMVWMQTSCVYFWQMGDVQRLLAAARRVHDMPK